MKRIHADCHTPEYRFANCPEYLLDRSTSGRALNWILLQGPVQTTNFSWAEPNRGRTIRKVKSIFSLHEFVFSLTACAGFFFSGEPLCTNFFFRQILPFFRSPSFFWTVKSWFIIYVFVLYKLFYTHNRSKDTGHFNAKSFRKCTHSERGGSHLEWTASLCIFSVPVIWNSSPTAHHNDAILHLPMKTILCGS